MKLSQVLMKFSWFSLFSVLSSIAVPVPDTAKPIVKSKERCRFYPSCSNTNCAFYHPTLPCKLFPNCKFADSCVFVHPRCKFDSSCVRNDCNFSHSQAIVGSGLPPIGEILVNLPGIQLNSNFLPQRLQSSQHQTTNPSASPQLQPSANFSPTAKTQTASSFIPRSASSAKVA